MVSKLALSRSSMQLLYWYLPAPQLSRDFRARLEKATGKCGFCPYPTTFKMISKLLSFPDIQGLGGGNGIVTEKARVTQSCSEKLRLTLEFMFLGPGHCFQGAFRVLTQAIQVVLSPE